MRKNRKLLILIAVTVAFIWIHSMMPPDMSEDESGFVVKVLEIFMGKGNVSELFIRKLAHFSEYCLLGLELMAYFGKFPTGAFHGLFVAAADETIQIFSGRGSSLLDVWLDCAGCVTGLVIIILILKKKTKREKDN